MRICKVNVVNTLLTHYNMQINELNNALLLLRIITALLATFGRENDNT